MVDPIGSVPNAPRITRAFSNIQPFTYSDGWSFLKLLEEMRNYIENVLVPFIREGLDQFADEVIAELNVLIQEARDILAQIEVIQTEVEATAEQVAQMLADVEAIYVQIQNLLADAIAAADRAEDAADRAAEVAARFITPVDFGAVGDGVTDDTAAWEEFKTATTGIHFVSPGNYLVNGEVKRFRIGVLGNGEFLDEHSAWDQPRGDRERHAVLVHRNELDPNVSPVSPIIKTQTHINWEVDNPPAASFKHVVNDYHEATLDGYYNIRSDTNQNFTVAGSTGRNRMAGLYGMLAHLAYIEDARETDNPLIASLGATKNGGQFIRFRRLAQYQSGGYMFGQEIYAMNSADEPEDIPYTNNNEFAFNAWTAGIKVGAFSTGAPISAAMFTHGSSTSKHGFWNGIVIGGSGFKINGDTQGPAGTVGLNLASWRTGGGFGDVGIRMRAANRHIYFVEGAKIRSSHTRFSHELGSAGISIESNAGGVPYLNFRTGATDAADGGNVTDVAVVNAGESRLSLRSVGEVHLEAVSGAAVYVGNSARFAPATANDGQLDLGSGTRRWKDVYATNGSIVTSDARAKTDIQAIPDDALDAWGDVNYSQYRMIAAVDEKGDEARTHTGVIAQRVMDAFTARGLDANAYGLLCHDSWPAEAEKVEEYRVEISPAVYEQVEVKPAEFETVTNEDGTTETREVMPPEYEDGALISEAVYETRRTVTAAIEAGDRYSVRYDEALSFEAAYQRRRADRIEARLEVLETMLG